MEKHDEFKASVQQKMRSRNLIKTVTRILLGLAVVFFVGSLVYAWLVSNRYTHEADNRSVIQDEVPEERVLDSDGDGLFDWQEDLYGTSKKLRDSDGDGVSDAQEVALGQDPNYFGEGVQIDSEVAPQEALYEEYEFQIQEPVPNPSLTGDFIPLVIKEITPELRSALNEAGSLVIGAYTNDAQDVSLFNSLFLREEVIDITRITQVIQKNYDAADQLGRAEAIPEIALEFQALENSFTGVATTLEVLVDSQSVEETEYNKLVLAYNGSLLELQKAINAIHTYVTAHQIDFAPDEPGHYFLFSL